MTVGMEGPAIMADPMVPPELWRRLRAFLEAGRTGAVTFHVKAGVVVSTSALEGPIPVPGRRVRRGLRVRLRRVVESRAK